MLGQKYIDKGESYSNSLSSSFEKGNVPDYNGQRSLKSILMLYVLECLSL